MVLFSSITGFAFYGRVSISKKKKKKEVFTYFWMKLRQLGYTFEIRRYFIFLILLSQSTDPICIR